MHCCCAPCSGAILECMLANAVKPVLYFYNPNIYPEAEYLLRKNELLKYAAECGLCVIDGDYDHARWLSECAAGLENAPERGERCFNCFYMRMKSSAAVAKREGIGFFTTTLSSSRWKDIDQIFSAARMAATEVGGVGFWDWNWRKGGLTQRRAEILRERKFYNQTYCGCEFSLASSRAHEAVSAPERGQTQQTEGIGRD